MDIKFKLKILILLLTTPLFIGCPEETFCDLGPDFVSIQTPDLITIRPETRNFRKGDTITLNFSVPSKGMSNGVNYDIFQRLNRQNSSKSINISSITDENVVVVNKGRLEDSQIILKYAPDEDAYQFSCNIILEKMGSYMQFGAQQMLRFGVDNRDCEYIDLTTNIKGIDEEGFYKFTVEE